MARIKRIEVINFRNLKHETFEFNNGTTLITGKNELGKSNLLNALCYIVCDCLLTDKYGSGENDIESIIPIGHEKGDHTEVSIWLDNEAKFSKCYKTYFDRKSNKANKHVTEYAINDVPCKNASEFYNDLYSLLEFHNTYDKLKVDAVRLLTDPLYALMKLDQKDLRACLVALGCSVSNEELYKAGFEDMRQYESKYLGRWSNMRKDYKDKIKEVQESIDDVEAQLRIYSDVETPDSAKLQELKELRDELIVKRNGYLNPKDENPLAKELKDLKAQLEEELKTLRTNKELELNNLSHLIETKNQELKFAKEKALNQLTADVSNAKAQFESANTELANLNLEIGRLNNEIEALNSSMAYIQKNIDARSEELATESAKTFDGNTCTCPKCFYEFQDQVQLAAFENEKAEKVRRLTSIIQESQQEKNNLESSRNLKIEAKANKEKERDSLTTRVNELRATHYALKDSLDNASANFSDEALKHEIEVLNEQKVELYEKPLQSENTQKLEALIKDYEARLQASSEATPDYTVEINSLNEEIAGCDNDIKDIYIMQEKAETKQALQNKLTELEKTYNVYSSVLARVTALIREFIRQVNSQAKALTGLDFVMLEENLTNDELKEVCYAVVDGVPFKDLNTSKKIITGVTFINNLRSKNENELPILCDRLEGIDSVEKIRNLTKYQLVGTRVSTDTNITLI